ncbi:MAG: ABC transporter permease, partial [Gemmatimonadaceae bacterium]
MSERPPWFRRAIAPGLVPGRASRAEMDEEIASHIEMRVADLIAAGLTPQDARAEAERRFGNLDESRRMLRAGARRRDSARRQRDRLGALLGDLRFAWRQMRRAPLFSAVAVATLAIGIGLTTGIFGLVDHVLLRPLPFVSPDRLVTLSSVDSLGNDFPNVSSSNWQDWRGATRFIESTAIHLERGVDLRTDQGAIRVRGALVSGAFFEALRPRFIAGRPFTAADVDGGGTAVVISERLWRTLQGAQPALSAPLQTLAGDWRIAGVVAAGQEYPPGTDVWHPTTIEPPRAGTRNNVNWEAVARLRPEATPEQAEEELASIAQRIRDSDPSALYSYGVEVRPLKARIVGDVEGYLTLLLGAAAFVLLIACANVAAANLARATRRSHEMGIRAAIGAGRGRIVQQLLVEHVLLAAIAGTLGIGLGWSALRVGASLWGARVPRAI